MEDIEKEMRIVDGACIDKEKERKERIKTKYKAGSGDDGYSLLMNGERISKAHPACNLYQSIEELQQTIGEFLIEEKLYNEQISLVLKWLNQSLFSLSSFAFCKGDTTRHQFPIEFLEYMDETIEILAEEVGGAPDFITHSHVSLLKLNKIRIASRKVESSYVGWNQSEEMNKYLRSRPDLIEGIQKHSLILNRLSTYFFWVTRKQGLWLYSVGEEVKESYWASECKPFILG